MLRTIAYVGIALSLTPAPALLAQNSSAATAAKPTEHVLGTVTKVDSPAHTITVKDDKSGTEINISLAATRTLLKVPPGAKDLKTAVRITAADLAVGDRVDVRGSKADPSSPAIDARSVVLMSARDLAQHRQAEAAAWQNSTVGTVTAVTPASNSITVNVRTPSGPKSVAVQTSPTTEWTRYSPADPTVPAHSALTDVQPGDQVRILGAKSPDEASIAADKIYSAPVRTIAATVTSVGPDGKQIVAKNVQTKQPVTIVLPSTAVVRKLDPQMAAMMARRFNGNAAATGGTGGQGGHPPAAGSQSENGGAGTPAAGGPGSSDHPTAYAGAAGEGGPGGSAGAHRGGDLSHMLERVPQITAQDLKPGDAIVIWGMAGQAPDSVDAQTVLAGVEPVLQSAPVRQGQSLGGDWGLDMATPAQ